MYPIHDPTSLRGHGQRHKPRYMAIAHSKALLPVVISLNTSVHHAMTLCRADPDLYIEC